jgi:hypothetical protein
MVAEIVRRRRAGEIAANSRQFSALDIAKICGRHMVVTADVSSHARACVL